LARTLATHGDATRVIRLMSLAASPRAAFSVIAGRVWPVAWRQGWRDAPEYFLRRAIRWTYRHLVFEQPSSAMRREGSGAAIALGAADAEIRLRDALRMSSVWIVPGDGAMEPAVPAFGMVRVTSPESRPLRAGDVIVTRGNDGQCTVQRVVSLGVDDVWVKPDAHFKGETAVSRAQLLGVCDLVDVGGRAVPVAERPHGTLGLIRAIARARLVPAARPHST
jgi:hypothetical protein